MTTAWLAQSVLDTMIVEAERADPYETGGILFGYRNTTQNAVVINGIVGPGPKAMHGPFEFEPDYEYQTEQTSLLYENPNTDPAYYLGDWHTHLKEVSRLSQKDKRTLKTIARDPEAHAPRPVMLVLKYSGCWRPVIWELYRKRVGRFRFGWNIRRCSLKIFGNFPGSRDELWCV